MFVITGASGNVGSVTATTLLEAGKAVRVVVRDAEKGAAWKKRGAEVAVADLGDTAALRVAMDGADGAFLLVPPAYQAADYRADRRRISISMEEACREVSVPHVVLLSSVAAHLDAGTGPIISIHDAEVIFREYPGSLTVLRPVSFMDNWEAVIGQVREHGLMPTFHTPDLKFPTISTLDIGRIAAECLAEPTAHRRVIEMTGPEDYSPNDVAATLSAILGKPVTAQAAPLDAVIPTYQSFGFSENAAQLMLEMYSSANSGILTYEGGAAEFRRGTVGLREGLERLLKTPSEG